VYHLELRQFPRNVNRFNLSEQELGMVLEPWTLEKVFEYGELKWTPHEAKLTILEGPRIPIDQLSMGRGWSIALRQSKDVTERVLAQARQTLQAAPATGAPQAAADGEPADRLLALLGDDPAALLQAWRLAAERRPELAPSEALALAEATLRSLDASEH
jgi:hypothetical protein